MHDQITVDEDLINEIKKNATFDEAKEIVKKKKGAKKK
jgi:hypothetical protein